MILESSDGRPMLKIKEFKGLPVATPTACALGPRTQATAWARARSRDCVDEATGPSQKCESDVGITETNWEPTPIEKNAVEPTCISCKYEIGIKIYCTNDM